MSVTIQTTFNDVVALQEPLVVSASSNQTGNIGTTIFKFRYVLVLDIDGTEVITVKQQPNANGYAHFDLHRILESYLAATYEGGSDQIHVTDRCYNNNNGGIFVEIDISEEYSTSETTDPSNQGGNATASFIAINTVFQFSDGVVPTLAGVYEYNDDNTALSWLSKMPTTLTTREGEYQTAGILISDFNGSTYPVDNNEVKMVLTYYEEDGTQINSYTIDYKTTLAGKNFVTTKNTTGGNKMIQFFPVGYQNLEDAFSTQAPSNQSDLAYYTIYWYDSVATGLGWRTKTYRFNLADCTKYTPIQLAWLNELGCWDYYTFDLASIEQLKIQRDSIRKQFGNWNAGADFTYSFYEGGERVTKIDADKEYTVNSDWLNDEEFIWLQSLLMSTDVLTPDENGNYVPVIITDNDYQIKKTVNEKLNSLTVKFKLSHKIR